MKRFIVSAVCSLQALVLQAQPPVEPTPFPSLRADDPAVPNGQSEPSKESADDYSNLTLKFGTGQGPAVEFGKVPPDAKYPIWLLIEPDGIQFLQTQKEIAEHRGTFHNDALLLGCATAKFEGAASDQNTEFNLNCEDFLMLGRYGTKQELGVTGAALHYSTKTKQLRMTGTEELPLEYEARDAASHTLLQADEIILQLHEDSFQLSVRGAQALEIHALPEAEKDFFGNPAGEDFDVPTYDPGFQEPKPTPEPIPQKFNPDR